MLEKEILEELYVNQQLSMKEIADQLNVSEHKVNYWMDKYAMPRRTWRLATYAKRNPNGDPYKIKSEMSPDDMFLLGLGLGLYWGEGNKKSTAVARLGNTDARLIKAYLEFLQKIGGVEREKITFQLQLFRDINEEEAVNYWIEQTGFPRENFRCIFYSPPQGKGTYKNLCQYGVLTVLVCNKKFRNWIITRLLNISEGRPII